MRKIISSLLFLIVANICSAQEKTVYCDVYARGSWNNMSITIMCNDNITQMQGNISTVLNEMTNLGWELEESIVIPRHPLFSLFTRHKLHFVMKKKYSNSDNITHTSTNITTTATSISNSNITKKETTSELMEEFSNNKIITLPSNQRQQKEKEFIAEINSDIKVATTKQDLEIIKNKIDLLISYNNSLSKKNYTIVDALNSFKYEYKKKAKKLGVKL